MSKAEHVLAIVLMVAIYGVLLASLLALVIGAVA
jgi:hypothetical protein